MLYLEFEDLCLDFDFMKSVCNLVWLLYFICKRKVGLKIFMIIFSLKVV